MKSQNQNIRMQKLAGLLKESVVDNKGKHFETIQSMKNFLNQIFEDYFGELEIVADVDDNGVVDWGRGSTGLSKKELIEDFIEELKNNL
jgi:hypothetical protein